jgi:predicted ArsR family transcriptional regulator
MFSNALPAEQVERLLRGAGKGLADDLLAGNRPTGSLEFRATTASQLLNDQLGALTHVEHNGGIVIRGIGCPLSALTGKHPAVCLAMESLVAEVVGARVQECCNRSGRPRCCFQIAPQLPRARRQRTRRPAAKTGRH